jgi:DNA polymerase III delta prime subunit
MSEFLWVEKYRPKTIDECILVDDIKNTFKNFVKNKEVPNLLLAGGSGMGKTTIAYALCNELDLDFIVLNGSKERGIDQIRNRVGTYASAVSLTNSPYKVVIFDEADYLTPEAQAALRRLIEEFSSNCKFILTCNYINKLIPALHSRCTPIEFKVPKKEAHGIAEAVLERLGYILDSEEVEYKPQVLAELIMKYIPDWRRCINELQRHSVNGPIDERVLGSIGNLSIDPLVQYLKSNHYPSVRAWVIENLDNDPQGLLRQLYDALHDKLEEKSIPEAVLQIADFSYKSAFVVDQEVNLLACLIQLMVQCEFK